MFTKIVSVIFITIISLLLAKDDCKAIAVTKDSENHSMARIYLETQTDIKEELPTPQPQISEPENESEIDVSKIQNFVLNLENISQLMLNPEDVVCEFKGDFEIGLKNDSFEKIESILPIKNAGRFIHDFSADVTCIVDIEGEQCFIMPLNHSSVLPPRTLNDLLVKMYSGYYTVDTKIIMNNMRVVKPAIKDLSGYGIHVANDCKDVPTYKIEKVVSEVNKRSAPTGEKTFSVFSGQMDSFKIINYYDVKMSP